MNALCIGRHRYLSDFLAAYFEDPALHTTPVVGLAEAERAAQHTVFDVVICDYDLISPVPVERWSSDPLLSAMPVVAVSLTRSADEAPMLDGSSLALYLYLPSFEASTARLMVMAARRPLPYSLPAFDRTREWARPSA